MRGIWARAGRDEGMTILEVMIAAVILFIVMTAILSLVTQTISIGMQSKEKTVFNNAVNSYIERVQAMDFDNVVIGTGPGQLPSVETIAIGDYTMTITPNVMPGATSDLKRLEVTATIQRGSAAPETLVTEVVIRDKSSYLTQGLSGPAVEWSTGLMPADGEVVWSSTKASGGVLWIAADVLAVEGTTISRIAITADNGWALQSTTGEDAIWDFEGDEQPEEWSLTDFAWNTQQEGIIDADTLEEGPVIPDGLRTITIAVTDSGGGSSKRTYTFIVDNIGPAAPGVPQLAMTAAGPSLTWAPSSDGNDLATGYYLSLRKRDTAGSYDNYLSVFAGNVATNSYALVPFTRYHATVKAIGIAPNSRESQVAAMTKTVITPPRASGTWVYGTSTAKVNLAVSAPTFPVKTSEYTTTYAWYRSASPNGPWTTLVGSTATLSNLSYPGTALYYRCTVTLKPDLDIDNTASAVQSFNSSVAGPTGTAKKSSGTLAEVWVP